MMRSRPHVVPLRLTRHEWMLLDRIAQARHVTVEEVVRWQLRFPDSVGAPLPRESRRLQLAHGAGESPRGPRELVQKR